MSNHDDQPDTDFQTAGDVVRLPGERLFWTVNGNAEMDWSVNPNTGTSTLIGYLGINSLWAWAMQMDCCGFSSSGEAVVIDPDTADCWQSKTSPGYGGAPPIPSAGNLLCPVRILERSFGLGFCVFGHLPHL